MLTINNPKVQEYLFTGKFGLEREALRLRANGQMSPLPAYFENEHITRDFCENQTEINTAPFDSLTDAMDQLHELNRALQIALHEHNEILWPFSNPGYIRDEEDIPIAFKDEKGKEESYDYRRYLSHRYGPYLMTFCGIHYNFSFSDHLLKAQFDLVKENFKDFEAFKEHFYLNLAKKASLYGWVITVLMGASPVIDSSFWHKGLATESFFTGFASMRSSALGYWNAFVPIFDYSSMKAYIKSFETYVERGLLKAPRELYYPIRLKPKGAYSINSLEQGVDHIELRMIDLNPGSMDSLLYEDARFCHLFLIWLAAMKDVKLSEEDQIQIVENFKRASQFDLELSFVIDETGKKVSLLEGTKRILKEMRLFFESLEESEMKAEALKIVAFEGNKLDNQKDKRYANIVYDEYHEDYLLKGIELAQFYQQQFLDEEKEHGQRL